MLDALLREALALPEERSPMGRALAVLLEDAARSGVSDVHLNPSPAGLEVLYRLDGVLHARARVEPARAEQFMGKVKVLAGLLTYRRDVPQDGQIPAADAGGLSDVRVSIVPTVGRVQASEGEGLRQFALAGVGLVRMAAFTVRDDIAAGRLVPVLEAYNPGDREAFHAIYIGRGGPLPARVRALLDYLGEHGKVG